MRVVTQDMVRRSCAIHEELMAWLVATYPQEDPMVILAACSYEIGRIVSDLGSHLNRDEREALLQDVTGIMRKQMTMSLPV